MQMTALNAVAMAVGRLIVRGDSNIVVAQPINPPPQSVHFHFISDSKNTYTPEIQKVARLLVLIIRRAAARGGAG